MSLQTLGYIGLRTQNLDDWADYAAKFLGMQLVDRTSSSLSFRMDDKKQRLVVNKDNADVPGFFGWEVENAAALDQYAARLEGHGVKVARGSRALADERFGAAASDHPQPHATITAVRTNRRQTLRSTEE